MMDEEVGLGILVSHTGQLRSIDIDGFEYEKRACDDESVMMIIFTFLFLK